MSIYFPKPLDIAHKDIKRAGQSHSVAGVVVLLNGQLDAFHTDLQDAGGWRVVLDCHSSVGGDLEKKAKDDS